MSDTKFFTKRLENGNYRITGTSQGVVAHGDGFNVIVALKNLRANLEVLKKDPAKFRGAKALVDVSFRGIT